jgi:hypothetical protein
VATAPPLQGPRTIWHVRGTWSARDDRTPSAVWLAILWLGMIVGFGLDLHHFQHEYSPAPKVLYAHAFVFTGWMVLLTAQVLLVLRNRIAWHRTLGWFLTAWACLMVVLGPWAAMAAQAATPNPSGNDTAFLSLNILNISAFIVLLAWGISLRKNLAAHRRMMILTTVAISDPGFARAFGYLVPIQPHSAVAFFFCSFYGNILLVVLMAGWDLWKGRLIRSFVFAATGMLAAEALAAALYFWAPWKALTLSWVQLWAKHFA